MSGEKKAPDLSKDTFPRESETGQEHTKRMERLSAAKRSQLAVTDFIQHDASLRKEYRALSKCGGELWFKRWLETGFRRLIHGNFCKIHLLCRLCAVRRGSLYNKKYHARITQVLKENPELVPVLITRTVRNGPVLEERYAHITDIHKRLMQRRRQSLSSGNTRGRSADSVMQYVRGSVGAYEFKRGRDSGLWHPHIHEIALLEPVFEFRDEEETCRFKDDDGEWKESVRTVSVPHEFRSLLTREYWMCSGDSYIVDVRRIELSDVSGPADDDFEVSSDRKEGDPLIGALCEVFKYALKFSSLDPEDQIHAWRTLKGRRLLFSYGCMRGVAIDESLLDRARSELETGPYVIELLNFVNRYCYELDQVLSDRDLELFERNRALDAAAERRKRSLRKIDSFRSDLNIPLHDGGVLTSADVEKFVAGRLGHVVREKKRPDTAVTVRGGRSNSTQGEEK